MINWTNISLIFVGMLIGFFLGWIASIEWMARKIKKDETENSENKKPTENSESEIIEKKEGENGDKPDN